MVCNRRGLAIEIDVLGKYRIVAGKKEKQKKGSIQLHEDTRTNSV